MLEKDVEVGTMGSRKVDAAVGGGGGVVLQWAYVEGWRRGAPWERSGVAVGFKVVVPQ